MATRRAGGGRRVSQAKSPNFGVVTRGARGVRVLAAKVAGQPSARLLSPGSSSIRGVRTLIKRDPAKGVTQPEAKTAMLTAENIHIDNRSAGGYGGARVISKQPVVATGRGRRVIKPPSPTNNGGIRRRLRGL